MIVLRVYLGIRDHFPARRSEWALSGIMIGWGVMLLRPGIIFDQSRAWTQMAAIMPETTWGWLAVAVGVFRFTALVINGTFAATWYGRRSPHVRALASFLACFLWLQIAVGLWSSGIDNTGMAVYPGLLALDLMNVVAAASDAAKMDRAAADGPQRA